MTSWSPFIPPDLPAPVGDPGQYRRFALEVSHASAELGRVAGTLGRESAAISGLWRSVPSSARASGRLDALADLGRTWRTGADEASLAVGGYASALEAAQGAVLRANRILAHARLRPLGPSIPAFGLTPGERRIVQDAEEHLRRLRVSDRSCAQTLHGCVLGEGRGAAAVAVRIRAADAAAQASPGALARKVHAALDTVPPDLITLEETIRALGRLSDDPTRAAAVLTALGADYGRALQVCARAALDPHAPQAAGTGFDASEMSAALVALARAAARAPVLPRPGSPGPGSPGHVPPGHVPPGHVPPGHVPAQPGPGPGHERSHPVPRHPSPPQSARPVLGVPPAHPPAPLPTPDAPIAVDHAQLLSALAWARAQVGHPDRFPPVTGPPADGASLSAGIWAAAGVDLPDTAAGQFAVGHHAGIGALRPGDLVFWTAAGAPGLGSTPTGPGGPVVARVAVYVGHNRVVIEPPSGEEVRLVTLDRTDPTLVTEVVRLTSP